MGNAQGDQFARFRSIFRHVFDTRAEQVALLTLEGVIVDTNSAWQRYGRENGLDRTYDCIGQNYLSICETAAERGSPGANDVYIGLMEVLHRGRPKFTKVYPCHSPSTRQWYRIWIEPQTPVIPAVIVVHYLHREKPLDQESASTSVLPDVIVLPRFDARQ